MWVVFQKVCCLNMAEITRHVVKERKIVGP